MKKGGLVFILLTCQILMYSQVENSTIPFISKLKIDWDDGAVAEERFFSILIPSNFDYDTTFDFASGYKGNIFYLIRSHVRIDYEEFLEKVKYNGRYDLVKYAEAMTKDHFSCLDSCTLSNVKQESIRNINGVPTLRIRYNLKETAMGFEMTRKYIMYLVPMFPKNPESFDINYQMMIFLIFSAPSETDDKLLNAFTDEIIRTIKPLK